MESRVCLCVFQHDNRESFDYAARRGRWRARGSFGDFRGRASYYNRGRGYGRGYRVDERSWARGSYRSRGRGEKAQYFLQVFCV